MTKLPEPTMTLHGKKNGTFTAEALDYYTEAQMLQFRRDALDEAEKLMWIKAGELRIFNHYATKELIGCVTKPKDET